jgi:hypothetical protein
MFASGIVIRPRKNSLGLVAQKNVGGGGALNAESIYFKYSDKHRHTTVCIYIYIYMCIYIFFAHYVICSKVVLIYYMFRLGRAVIRYVYKC